MSGLEPSFDVLMATFNQRLEKGMTNIDASDEEKEALRKKFADQFSDNIKLGLAVVFGNDGSLVGTAGAAAAADLPPPSSTSAQIVDIGADDLQAQESAMVLATSRRSRYPLKAAKYLEKTLKKNRTMLKNLKTDIPKKEINVGDCDADSNIRVEEQLNKISADIGYCRRSVTNSVEKSDRLVESFRILRNTEVVCSNKKQ